MSFTVLQVLVMTPSHECVNRGICKVNIYTDLVKVMIGKLKEDMQQQNPNIVSVIDNMHNAAYKS